MSAMVGVALVATIIAVLGLLGRSEGGLRLGGVVLAAFPLMVLSVAVTAPAGITVGPALIASVAVVVGVLAARLFAAGSVPGTVRGLTGGALNVAVAVLLAAAVLAWTAPLMFFIAGANAVVATVVLAVAAGIWAAGGRSTGLVALIGLVVMIVVVILAVAVAAATSPASALTAPMVAVPGNSPIVTIGAAAAIVLIGAANPALRQSETSGRRYAVGAVLAGAITFVFLLACLLLLGGSLQTPAWGLSVLNSYFPPAVVAVAAAGLTIVAVMAAGLQLRAGVHPWLESVSAESPTPTRWLVAAFATATAAAVVCVLAGVPAGATVGWLAVLGVVSLIVGGLRRTTTAR